jgi:zinc protease
MITLLSTPITTSRMRMYHTVVRLALLLTPIGMAHADEDHSAVSNTGPITALNSLRSLKDQPVATVLRTPHVEDFKTQHGTRVLFVAAPELPIVDIRLTFDAGSARDVEIGSGLYGLASLTAQLLDEGTSTQNTDQIAERFETLGAQYSASAYRDMFTVDLRSLSDTEHLNPAVNQLLQLLQDAQFPQSSIDRVFQNAAIGQKQREESPATLGGIRFWRELYGTHPYAEPSSGTQASLRKITPTDIRQFKNQFLVSNNLNLSITGQLTLQQAKALAEQITQSLPQGQHAQTLPAPAPLSAAKTIMVKFKSTQTHIIIGQLGLRRNDPDLPALTVGNEVLGGGDFNALLMKELREKRGMTYGAYSGFSPMRSNGPFTISYSTRADQAAESIRVARQTLTDYLQQGADPTALAEAQEGLLNSYPLSLSSNTSINAYLSMMGFYDLPATYLADYPKQIAAVTPEAVRSALNRHIQSDKMLTVVVGQPLTPDISTTVSATMPTVTLTSQTP